MQKKTLKTPPELPNDIEEYEDQPETVASSPSKPIEIGGPKGPEPTRYGDWENAGRCSDF
jgi:hypothetical protein